MAQMTLSVLGLWNYNPFIFNNMSVPAGIDKATLESNILLECAELEILYADPVFMQMAIREWSKTMLPVWEKLYNTTQLTYNPIHNYDRHEEYEDTTEATGSQNSFENAGFVPAAKQDGSVKHEAHLYGNIGVTSTQDMLKQEREVAQYNIYQQIVNDFKNRFCLLIY